MKQTMKICIAQQNYIIGNISGNLQKILQAVNQAKSARAEMIVFSEMAVCGYPPKDFLEFQPFLQKCFDAIETLAAASKDIAIIVGAPAINPKPEGKSLFNAAYFLAEGKVQQVIHKALLPTYDIFDEYRYFEPGFDFHCITWKGLKIAVTICEDIWDMEADPIYRFRPMDILIKENPAFMVNLSASPFDYFHAEKRAFIIGANATTYQRPLIYCNTVGAQTEIIFDGGSTICNADKKIVTQLPCFEEALSFVMWTGQGFETVKENEVAISLPDVPPDTSIYQESVHIDLIHQALVMGIREYFVKTGCQQAIVASSGGIDSAVTLALAVEALGKEKVRALLLPSQFSTDHSVSDAVQLSQNLDNKYDIISIKEIFETVHQSLQPVFGDLPFDVTEENIQSRIRGLLVMALANKYQCVLLNTSNKSELATGYGTLYGDMAGGLSVLGDLYKTQVYALARHINRNSIIIPENIIHKAPSAELRPGQKDSDSLPDYTFLDKVLYQFIEERKSTEEILALGWDEAQVKRTIAMLHRNEFKRHQFCPILRVSSKAFGSGRRMPIVSKYEF